ncbi:MAG: nitroreductase [Candidatus Omnitrophota bacterium]
MKVNPGGKNEGECIIKLIKSRRSVRRFKKGRITNSLIKKVIDAGRWAPSGLNNQPWKFKIIRDTEKAVLSSYTRYGDIIKGADTVILLFLDKKSSYHREKDFMAIGACIQNMLLYIHSLRLGACWLGEIINQKERIHKDLNLPSGLELAAAICLGEPARLPKTTRRKEAARLMIA